MFYNGYRSYINRKDGSVAQWCNRLDDLPSVCDLS